MCKNSFGGNAILTACCLMIPCLLNDIMRKKQISQLKTK